MKKDWETKKLGAVCEIELGRTPSRGNKSFWDNEKTTTNVWLSIADLLNAEERIVSDSKEYLSDKGVKISKIVKSGTLLVSFKLTLGRLAFTGKDLYTNEAIAALTIKNKKELSNKFLYHFLSYFDWNLATKGDIKVKGKTLNKAKLKEIKIKFPKFFSEQKQIVKILDDVFEKVSKAKESAEKNLQNARELFESYLQSIFTNPGDGWEEKKVGEICDILAGQSPEGKYYNNVGNGLAFYQGKKRFTEKFIGVPTTWTTNITKEALQGDILMSVRAPVGPVNFATEKICIGRGLAAIRTTALIDREFLFYFLLKHEKKVVGNTGAVFNSINKTQIASILIPLPSLSEQNCIVAKLDTLSAETKKLEAIYQQKLTDLDELKKSILQKAFNGEF